MPAVVRRDSGRPSRRRLDEDGAIARIEELSAAGAAEGVDADERALAGGITRLLSDPDRRRAMGERGRELHVREFSVERMVEQYRRLYADLLAERI